MKNGSFWFELIGWFYCLVTGNLRKFNILRAQAMLETGHYGSTLMMGLRNPWGMHMPTLYAEGNGVEGDGGMLAKFPGWWTAWKARLAWDERKSVNLALAALNKEGGWTLTEYCAAVVAAGYNTNPAYVQTWLDVYKDQVSTVAQFVDPPLDNSTWWDKVKTYALWLVLITSVTWLTYQLVKWLLRKARKK